MSLILGVLGGMGPRATLEFLAKLQAYTPAERDQDHIRVLMDLNPQVPDRNVPGAAAGPVLAEMAGGLAGGGAEILAMPCNTAHAHADLIVRATGLPLIDMIGGAAKAAAETGARRVGVLGTKGALRLYREYLAARGLGLVTLPAERQGAFMALLYRIKAGDLSREACAEMAGLARELVAEGAEALIAGCTEAPLVLGPADTQVPLIDAGDLLAQRCVAVCLEHEPPPPI
ncbi:MAG: amino acid racemase [Phenylobacterium sp.]|uniref:aspartate/glutamate racemase family protein n=1 Tax=Phenylobacterium sp. TaxID=1871053 RepID=UPI0027267FA6|nr:amino acid racemase [Phenylobacterium sp.]MDO8901537.1 amino acid racemase [Phenylobacterium sp.]